jgi:predicted ATPase
MIDTRLREIIIEGLHGQRDIEAHLAPGLNIIYGQNGSGKTTLLHVVANLAERDIERFCHINFKRIRVVTFENQVVELTQLFTKDGRKTRVLINNVEYGEVALGQPTPDIIDDQLRKVLGGRPVYLPAFRSVLEAITENRSRQQYAADPQRDAEVRRIMEREQAERRHYAAKTETSRLAYSARDDAFGTAYKTLLCREWFGGFVPVVRFPSLNEVAEQLFEELRQAQVNVASTDRQSFSEVFVKVLHAVLERPESLETTNVDNLLGSIRDSLQSLQTRSGKVPSVYYDINSVLKTHLNAPEINESIAARILEVYDDALRDRIAAEKEEFKRIQTFENSVNHFLKGKKLKVELALEPSMRVRAMRSRMIDLGKDRHATLSVLSSGERHVLTLLFSATHMSAGEGLLLIDEPELSLHVDWQRVILGELIKQAGDRQIIACTHAPEVTAEHRRAMTKLRTRPYQFDQVERIFNENEISE